jgi:hypothetical protein
MVWSGTNEQILVSTVHYHYTFVEKPAKIQTSSTG